MQEKFMKEALKEAKKAYEKLFDYLGCFVVDIDELQQPKAS